MDFNEHYTWSYGHKSKIILKELGHHISDHNAINSTAILFLPYKEEISLDYYQFTGLWVQ